MNRREHWITRGWLTLLIAINFYRQKPSQPSAGTIVSVDSYAEAHGLHPLVVVAAITENRMVPPGYLIPQEAWPTDPADSGQCYMVTSGAVIIPRKKELQAAIDAAVDKSP